MKKNFIQAVAIIVMAFAIGVSVNYFRQDGLNMKKNWSLKSRMTTDSGENLIIPLKQAEKIFIGNKAVFIDARSEKDYKKSHIKGALNLPFYRVDEKFMNITAGIPTDKLIITYCDGETCNLSHDLAEFLLSAGFNRVKVLINGLSVWKKAGMPLESVHTVQAND